MSRKNNFLLTKGGNEKISLHFLVFHFCKYKDVSATLEYFTCLSEALSYT